jgi:acyl-homoserine lactone acylase PvdQ
VARPWQQELFSIVLNRPCSVSIGHNDYGGWGLTIFGADREDLYAYDTNPANPSEYEYRGGWERMTSRGHPFTQISA